MRLPFGLAGLIVLLCLRGQPVALKAQQHRTPPTFLYRYLPSVPETPSDLTTSTCHYHAVFGAGDKDAEVSRGVARYGELIIDAGGVCRPVSYPAEEQAYFVLDGDAHLNYGGRDSPLRKSDFCYLAPGANRELRNPATRPVRIMVMGYKIPAGGKTNSPAGLLAANAEDVKLQEVEGHPPTSLFRLLMGDRESKRDRIASGQVLTSLFLMEFAPGGTNWPHHHETEEEIYLVLGGRGQIVAGGGTDGVEGRYPVKAGDAYFFRLNCTVGFYSETKEGEDKARILAVRSRFPFDNR